MPNAPEGPFMKFLPEPSSNGKDLQALWLNQRNQVETGTLSRRGQATIDAIRTTLMRLRARVVFCPSKGDLAKNQGSET